MTRILLPANLVIDTVLKDGPVEGTWFDGQSDELLVCAESPIEHAEPLALAALAAWSAYHRALGRAVLVHDSLKSRYSWSIGLLSALAGGAIVPGFGPDRFLAPCRVRTSEDVAPLLASIGPILRLAQGDPTDAVLKCLSETVRNVLEHSQSDGAWVSCSHFPTADRVSLAVVDTGVGVPSTIRRTRPTLTDEQALTAAIQYRVSGAAPIRRVGGSGGSADNAGIGLYYVSSIAARTDGLFALLSGNAYVRGTTLDSLKSGTPNARWMGTAVAISFRPSRANAWQAVKRDLLQKPSVRGAEEPVRWGPCPSNGAMLAVRPSAEGLVEDKDAAKRMRDDVVLPALGRGSFVCIDLRDAREVTHSFVHALLYEAFVALGAECRDLLFIWTRSSQVRDTIRIVAGYAFEDARKSP